MVKAKANDRPHVVPECPVCRHPQTKMQRRLTATISGSTMYVCSRVGHCTIGKNLHKMDTWVVV
jgi:hypothetical protein